jgi:transcriptional regulator with XRE-family HTH domain
MQVRKRPIDPTIGRRLAAIRLRRGWTQKQLAGAVGVTTLIIKRYEHGRTAISAGRLLQLAEALDCRAADILAPLGTPLLLDQTWEELP